MCLQYFQYYIVQKPRGRLLVNCVPMREQRIAKLTLNSVFDKGVRMREEKDGEILAGEYLFLYLGFMVSSMKK